MSTATELRERIALLEKIAAADIGLESKEPIFVMIEQVREQLRGVEVDDRVHQGFLDGTITLEQYHKHQDHKVGIPFRSRMITIEPIRQQPRTGLRRFIGKLFGM